jgi:P-type Cu+ transporter
MEAIVDEKKCHHCGDPCTDSISSDHYFFCCYGCKAVDELLNEVHLGKYYAETSKESKSLSQIKAERKYAFLDNEDIQKQLIQFSNDDYSLIRLSLPEIHCSSCIYLLEHLPQLDPSISRSQVNFTKREVSIYWNKNNKSLKHLAVLLSQIGYPPNLTLESLDKTRKHVMKSNLGIKIAVSGFCFGNAMLMSMPEYLDTNSLLTDDFKTLFGWINLMLALPVLLFAGSDYFVKAWKGIRISTFNMEVPIALGLLTLFGRSAFEIITQTGGGYVDSLAGLVFFLLIGKWYQGKTYNALSFERDYASYFPISVTCLVGHEESQKQLKELRKGDRVIIHNDELIPADGKIVNGFGNIDYSFVTGESQPITKHVSDLVFAGGRQKGGELTIEIDRNMDSSELTQLWNNDELTKRSTLHSLIDQVGHYFTIAIVLIAFATGVYWYLVNPETIWNATTAVLIVACPCALALTLPFAYGHAMRELGKAGLYLKNAEVIESLAKIDHVVFDKTGTLTECQQNASYFGEVLSEKHIQILKSVFANSAHPLSQMIHQSLPSGTKHHLSEFQEIIGQGVSAIVNGILVKIGSSEFVGNSEIPKGTHSVVHLSMDSYIGYFEIKTTYRKGIFEVLNQLKHRVKLSLLSGDNDAEEMRLAPYFNFLKFSQKPADKLAYVSQGEGKFLMVGDGLNDAGALKKADVGIAISENIHQFSPACDAILSAQQISILPTILTFSKSVKWIVFIALGLSLLYNLVGLSFAMTGHLTPLVSAILMPISSVTVVVFVTMMVKWKGRMLNSK